jgi:hypothetical protein
MFEQGTRRINYVSLVADGVNKLKDDGFAVELRGARDIFIDGQNKSTILVQKWVCKSAGGFLHATIDLEFLYSRIIHESPRVYSAQLEEIVYVTD